MIDWISVLQVVGGLTLVWVLCARLGAGSAQRRVVPNPEPGRVLHRRPALLTSRRFDDE